MQIYVRPNSIILVGKAWEIRSKLKEYAKKHDTVVEWIVHLKENNAK
ncbi:Z-ring formation inhibitor MciZ [Bacillus tianshenii]|nr:Z-ring formation inhibitor MciZ [Bacillus tianshenii]MCA1321689.1 Z-ring formation inhibitor MciZ [Bacillus tianshenii]